MHIAVIGLANSGKTTIFNALTGQRIETTTFPTPPGDIHRGVVPVPDTRLDFLSALFKPKKTTPATIEYVDLAGLSKGDAGQNRLVCDAIKDADALVHVVRLFEHPAVAHPLGTLDPSRDIELVEIELVFADLELVEKRFARIEEAAKRGKKPDEAERKLLLKLREILINERPIREGHFDERDLLAMRPLQFLTAIPEIVVLNCGERDIGGEREKTAVSELSSRYPRLPFLFLCGKMEMEIAELPPDDRKVFLADLGVDEPASGKLIRACHRALGLVTFFTYAGDEVRAWTIKSGTPALKAAGKIHSDIERGFIRAEVIAFEDLAAAGDVHAARKKGLVRLEGKTYEMRDGDVVHFRFNV